MPEKIRIPYFKVKILELLLYLDAMTIPQVESERPYFYKTQVEKVEAIKRFLIEHVAENFTQEELSSRFDIPMTPMKTCFRSVYGAAIGTWLKNYRMNLAAELLLIGTRRRWALYLSMVVFGLAPYAYGLAAVSVPCILLPMAIFLTARKKVKPLDLAVCVAIFAAVSGPYYATMVINAFGLETMTLGRMTMPRFEKSQRVNDISLGSPNPYLSMAQKLRDFLPTATGYYPAEGYSGIAWADTMYPFVIPAALYGWYRLCRDRRRLALRGSEEPLRDGGMLILVWMFAAIINTTMVGAVVNRNNILYYPWILCAAYALWQMGRRLRTALAVMVVMIAIGFAGACGVYFTDADYQTETANTFLYGAQEALREAWDWDCDRYYLTTMSRNDGEKVMTAQVMFAHQIDYAMRSEEEELRGSDGQPNGWFFTERYIFQNFSDFTPDPTECAVYIVRQNEKALFDEADYLITDFGNFAAVYPRYWAE